MDENRGVYSRLRAAGYTLRQLRQQSRKAVCLQGARPDVYILQHWVPENESEGVMKKQLCFETKIGGFEIRLTQVGRDNFAVILSGPDYKSNRKAHGSPSIPAGALCSNQRTVKTERENKTMLVITRKAGETFELFQNGKKLAAITVNAVDSEQRVTVGIEADQSVTVLRTDAKRRRPRQRWPSSLPMK